MSILRLSRKHVAALIIGVCTLGVVQAGPVAAQSVGPSAAPTTFDAVHPTISGTLVAKPVTGEGSIPSPCRDRDNSVNAAATMQRRGIVVCTEEGRLVLLQLTRTTGFYARYWGRIALRYVTVGDHINAWGVLTSGGYVLNPTYGVQDTDVQEANVDSQDFIAQSGARLMLFVLKSDSNGPVNGMVHAARGGVTHVILCNGQPGTWAALTTGKTIDITESLFNRRLDTYVHTGRVRIISCP